MIIEDIVGKKTKQFMLKNKTGSDLLPLYETFKKYDYTEKAVFGRLGAADIDQILIKLLPAYLDIQLKENTPLDKLIKLFLLAQPVSTDELTELFNEEQLQFFHIIGLLDKTAGSYKSTAAIFPCMDGFFATDHMFTSHVSANTVYPLGLDSYLLSRALLNPEVENTLDMCTGCGLHAIFAAKYSKRVTGVDKNPRAVNFAQFNALLNQVENVRFLAGDLYEPVNGEKFDWIIANPPFVPSPDSTLYFRHGSSSGEGISKRVIAGIPEFLTDNGYAQLVSSLVFRKDENYLDKIKGWLNDNGFHLLVLSAAPCHVEKYIQEHITTDPNSPQFNDDLKLWVNSYRENGIISIADGLMFMKRSNAPVSGQVSPAQSAFRKFRVPDSGRDIGRKIKSIIDILDAVNDDEAFNTLIEGEFHIAEDIHFWWEGRQPDGERFNGVLFKQDSVFESEIINGGEVILLDLIADGTVKGMELQSKFEEKTTLQEGKKERDFRNSLMDLLKKGAVEAGLTFSPTL